MLVTQGRFNIIFALANYDIQPCSGRKRIVGNKFDTLCRLSRGPIPTLPSSIRCPRLESLDTHHIQHRNQVHYNENCVADCDCYEGYFIDYRILKYYLVAKANSIEASNQPNFIEKCQK